MTAPCQADYQTRAESGDLNTGKDVIIRRRWDYLRFAEKLWFKDKFRTFVRNLRPLGKTANLCSLSFLTED